MLSVVRALAVGVLVLMGAIGAVTDGAVDGQAVGDEACIPAAVSGDVHVEAINLLGLKCGLGVGLGAEGGGGIAASAVAVGTVVVFHGMLSGKEQGWLVGRQRGRWGRVGARRPWWLAGTLCH